MPFVSSLIIIKNRISSYIASELRAFWKANIMRLILRFIIFNIEYAQGMIFYVKGISVDNAINLKRLL